MVKKKKKNSSENDIIINTEEDWNNLKNIKGLVIVDVYTKWAGPCEVMKPVLQKIKNGVKSIHQILGNQ